MVAVLQQVGGGRIIAIERAVVLVGRGADCDVVITASAKISRRHCCLVQVDKDYYLRDLGSMNGVWLNGERVKRETVMRAGDRVSIGDVEFLFHPNARIEQKKTVVNPAAQAATASAATRAAEAPRPTQAAVKSQKQPVANAAANGNSQAAVKAKPGSTSPQPTAKPAASGTSRNRNSRRPADRMKSADRMKVVEANADSFEIIDDVIPLDESGIPMIGTNEFDVINDPLIDEDDL